LEVPLGEQDASNWHPLEHFTTIDHLTEVKLATGEELSLMPARHRAIDALQSES